MSSQEEYLDQLLKGMMDEGSREEQDTATGGFDVAVSGEEAAAAGPAVEEKESYDMEDVQGMGIEDINRILEENARKAQEQENLASKELDELLSRSDEPELLEIQEILGKADRDEAVDECIVDLIESSQKSDEEIPEEVLEQAKEDGEESGPKKKGGLFGGLFGGGKKGKKKEKKKSFERKKAEEFEYEVIELFGDMELIDGDEKNKTGIEKLKDKWKKRREERKKKKEEDAQEAEKREKFGESPKKKKKKRGKSIDDALTELTAGEEDAGLDAGGIPDAGTVEAGGGTNADELQEGQEDSLSGIFDAVGELPEIRDKDAEDPLGSEEDMGLPPELLEGIEGLPEGGEEGNLEDLLGIAEKIEKDRAEKTEKKKGLFAKLFEFLTEEDKEEQQDGDGLILSDENEAVLKELEQEDAGKKKKKKKPKKGKAPEGEEGEEGAEKKGKKEKKPKKPKKEKPPKSPDEEEPAGPEKKLSKRRVILIFLICLTLGGAFLVLSIVTTDFSQKKKAAEAFNEGNYEECYQNLVGKNLSESETVMFGKSESILRIRLWMREYEMLAEAGKEPEALDSLMQSVHDFPTLYAFSGKWNAVSEVQEVFDQMLAILRTKYRLTEEEAKLIANEEDDLLYSQMVRTMAGGGEYGDWEKQENIAEPEEVILPPEDLDILPEEEESAGIPFVD